MNSPSPYEKDFLGQFSSSPILDETNANHFPSGEIDSNEIKDISSSSSPKDRFYHEETPSEDSTFLSLKDLLKFCGPGFLMSIAYLDPGNIESDLRSGSVAKYSLLWLLLVSTILGLFVQRLSLRLGAVTKKHLAQHCRKYYPKKAYILLWIMIEIAIIGSDMQEVIGTTIALYLLSNATIPLYAGILITICDALTFLLIEKFGMTKLEAFFSFLISVMAITFGYCYFISPPSQVQLLHGLLIPDFTKFVNVQYSLQAIGIVGAVLMPHNLFLHSALITSRPLSTKYSTKATCRYYFVESTIALSISFIINLFVVGVFGHNVTSQTNQSIRKLCQPYEKSFPSWLDAFPANKQPINLDIYSAGVFLGCTFSPYVAFIWGIGILAAGQSSLMTGTYSGQYVMQGFLNIHWAPWLRVLITRCFALLPTLILVTVSSSLPKLTNLNDSLNALQSLQLPFALLPLLTLSFSSKVMRSFACGAGNKLILLTLSLLVICINAFFAISFFRSFLANQALLATILVLLCFAYFGFILYLFYFLLVVLGFNHLEKMKDSHFLLRLFLPNTKALSQSDSEGDDDEDGFMTFD